MKKIILAISLLVLISACSTKETVKNESTNLPQMSIESIVENTPTPKELSSPKEDYNFSGLIGNTKLYAKLQISEKKIEGIYFTDQDKNLVSISGEFTEELKDYKTFEIAETKDKKSMFKGLIKSPHYFVGVWQKGSEIIPFYLIGNELSIAPPKEATTELLKMEGHWNGKNSGFFSGSELDIKLIYDEVIYFSHSAHNGSHMGIMEGFGVIKGKKASAIFKDTANYEEKGEHVRFEYALKGKELKVDSNMYGYMCGMGVEFDSEYTKDKIEVKVPTAVEVGIVETKEQDEGFKKLVGEEYNNFISYSSGVNYSDATMDGKTVQIGSSIILGLPQQCYYIISDEYLYAAIAGEEINFYTNDKKYESKIPELMESWAKGKAGLKVKFHYKEK